MQKRTSRLPDESAPYLPPGRAGELPNTHKRHLEAIEAGTGLVVVSPGRYPDGYRVPPHRHTRAQLLYAATGVVMVATDEGRWMVPPEHALWVPAGLAHAVEMQGEVVMHSVYVMPGSVTNYAPRVRVVSLTPLMANLIGELMKRPWGTPSTPREELIMALTVSEIPNLEERPLGLPFPAEPKLAQLCRAFVAAPDPHLTIESWAEALAMSRRAFTRAFRRETGVSLSVWRQQACLFNALPRLAAGESVTSVALDLGYDSVAAFTTMFTRMLGTAPRTYLGKRVSKVAA